MAHLLNLDRRLSDQAGTEITTLGLFSPRIDAFQDFPPLKMDQKWPFEEAQVGLRECNDLEDSKNPSINQLGGRVPTARRVAPDGLR